MINDIRLIIICRKRIIRYVIASKSTHFESEQKSPPLSLLDEREGCLWDLMFSFNLQIFYSMRCYHHNLQIFYSM